MNNLKLSYNEVYKKWHWFGDYESRFTPKSAGMLWDRNNKIWYTKEAKVAEKLIEYIDDCDKPKLEQQLTEIKQQLEESQATTADIEIPIPEGLEYMPFQKAGINFALKRQNTLIADEMGLGKTIQAIGIINATSDMQKILVVCPATIKINWKNELEKWLINKKLSISMSGTKDFNILDNILIVNYASLKKHHEQLTAINFDLMILDESHYIKNYKAQRTKLIFGAPKQDIKKIHTKKILALTGTPILNKPQELWTIAVNLANETFKNWWHFHTKYCGMSNGKYGYEFDLRRADLHTLQEKLRLSIMIRRNKKEVLPELPDKIRQLITIEDDKILQQEKNALKKLGVSKKEFSEKYKNDVEKLKQKHLYEFTELAKIRHETGLAKVKYCIDQVKDILENVDKIIVFAHHKDVIDELKKGLKDFEVVILTGDNSQEQKNIAVEKFQNGIARILIGSIKAAGLGLTLTAASTIIFCELDWTPASITQAEDRAHRIGQKDCVSIYHIVIDGSIDAKLAKMLVEKQKIINSTVNIDEILTD